MTLYKLMQAMLDNVFRDDRVVVDVRTIDALDAWSYWMCRPQQGEYDDDFE